MRHGGGLTTPSVSMSTTYSFSESVRIDFYDADYVICMIRQGGLEAFQLDIDIPLKYGVDQCVGDTICAGGIMYGQRTIPALLDFCKDIREVAKPARCS
jgi:alpha-galactosidase/6-phospho-beta-glucosidase family protein